MSVVSAAAAAAAAAAAVGVSLGYERTQIMLITLDYDSGLWRPAGGGAD